MQLHILTMRIKFLTPLPLLMTEIKPVVLQNPDTFLCKVFGLIWVEALRASQQFFSHIGTEPPLPITSTFWEVTVSCSRIQHGDLSEDPCKVGYDSQALNSVLNTIFV